MENSFLLANWFFRINEISKKELVSFFVFTFSISFIILFLSFDSMIWIESAHHDNTRYFRVSNADEFKSHCRNDSQYGWLFLIGRPASAMLECQVFKNTRQLSDLGRMRFFVIGIIAAASALLAVLISQFGISRLSAGMVAISVFSLPGMQNAAFMTNFPNALTPFLAIGAYMILLPVKKNHPLKMEIFDYKRIALASGILGVAMMLYPAMAFAFFWGSLLKALLDDDFGDQGHTSSAFWDIVVFGSVSVLVLISHRVLARVIFGGALGSIPESFKHDLSPIHMIGKIPFLLLDVIPTAASFWFMKKGVGSFLFAGILLASLFLLPFLFRESRKKISVGRAFSVTRIILILVFLVCCFSPVLLTKVPMMHQRVLFSGSGALLLISFCVIPMLVFRPFFSDYSHLMMLRRGIAWLFLIVGLGCASFNSVMNVWNTNIEMEFVRFELAKYESLPRRIHVIRSIDNNRGFNGLASRTDEFNRKTNDYKQDIVDFIRLSLFGSSRDSDVSLAYCDSMIADCELVVPKDNIIVSISEYGDDICATKDMALVDLNALVRSTRTGAPSLVDLENLPSCKANKFLIATEVVSLFHGVGKAFDKSTSADSFWEAKFVKPISIDFDYNVPTKLREYIFYSGDAPSRMPIRWKVLASNDASNWVLLDQIKAETPWKDNEKRQFEVKNSGIYEYYRFVFEESSDPEMFRIYEISLID